MTIFKNNLVAGKYKLVKKLGEGAFGHCHQALSVHDGQAVALKFQKTRSNSSLFAEAKLCRTLSGGLGMPTVSWSGTDGEYNIMAMELMGASVEDLSVQQPNGLSLKSVVMLGDQMVNRLEYVHSRGYIHRDVKPDNFVIGRGAKAHLVHIIDFGLAKRFRLPGNILHVPYSEKASMVGTLRYASINAHLKIEQSRRDDLESLAYSLIYLANGSLPWQGLDAESSKERSEKIVEMKINTPISELIGDAPEEFGTFLEYCRHLRYEEAPDYDYLREILRGTLKTRSIPYDLAFDWITDEAQIPAPRRAGSRTRIASTDRDDGDKKAHEKQRLFDKRSLSRIQFGDDSTIDASARDKTDLNFDYGDDEPDHNDNDIEVMTSEPELEAFRRKLTGPTTSMVFSEPSTPSDPPDILDTFEPELEAFRTRRASAEVIRFCPVH